MTPPDPVSDDPAAQVTDRLAALEREVDGLRDALAAHQAAVLDEVRTHRLVVVDRDGFARVVAEGGAAHASVAVRARATGPGATTVQLFADDPVDGDVPHAGVVLGRGGDVVATFEVGPGGRAALWLGDGDGDDDD